MKKNPRSSDKAGRASRRSILALACAACIAPLGAAAQDAARAVRIVVPFAAGGGTDVVARLVGTRMATALKVPVVVDNRAGAGGSIGANTVAKAPADGTTVLMGTVSTQAINPALQKSIPYDPVADFTPVSLLVRVPQIVVVSSKLPYRRLDELVAAMKKDPGKLTFGSQGIGGIAHLMGEMLNTQAGVKSTHVPYKGAAPAIQDLLAGNIDVLYETLPALLPHIREGRVRPLAVASASRLPQLPDVPTTAEAGMPQLVVETWNALFVPARTPADVVAKLSDAAREALKDPQVARQLQDMGARVVGSTPAELAAFNEAEVRRWAPVVKASGATAD
jgi:tripartite-type tricarboxylate transporter receptor subunit TctC